MENKLVDAGELVDWLEKAVDFLQGTERSGVMIALIEKIIERIRRMDGKRPEQEKLGAWQLCKMDSCDNATLFWRCSYCKGYGFRDGNLRRKYRHCPGCGARMSGTGENGGTA